MVLILSDSDVARSCTASRAIAVIRKAIHAHGEGRLAAPPRAHTELAPSTRVTFTAGALEGVVHGVRIYDNTDAAEQVVAVWDATTGRLSALVLGAELGRRRTGAIGAVAIDTLARPDAATLGVIGTGYQAWAQVWAATAVRTWQRVHVFGRNGYVRERFAARCREQLLVDAVPVDSAEAAVRGMDAVIVATNSPTPVFETSWLEPGAHVSTLGPKTISAHEVPLDLLDRVEVAVTDSLAQVHGHGEPYALSTRRMVELGAIMTGRIPGRMRRDQITLFCSVGLSGTEVVLAADLAGLPTGPAPAMTAALPVIPHAAPDGDAQREVALVGSARAALTAAADALAQDADADGEAGDEGGQRPAELAAVSSESADDGYDDPDTPAPIDEADDAETDAAKPDATEPATPATDTAEPQTAEPQTADTDAEELDTSDTELAESDTTDVDEVESEELPTEEAASDTADLKAVDESLGPSPADEDGTDRDEEPPQPDGTDESHRSDADADSVTAEHDDDTEEDESPEDADASDESDADMSLDEDEASGTTSLDDDADDDTASGEDEDDVDADASALADVGADDDDAANAAIALVLATNHLDVVDHKPTRRGARPSDDAAAGNGERRVTDDPEGGADDDELPQRAAAEADAGENGQPDPEAADEDTELGEVVAVGADDDAPTGGQPAVSRVPKPRGKA